MEKDKLMSLYNRTLNNCMFYESEKDNLHLLSEIGCLRGIAYCLEEFGVSPVALSGLVYFIEVSNKLLSNNTD